MSDERVEELILKRVEALERKIDKMIDSIVTNHERIRSEIYEIDKKVVGLKGRVIGIAGGISALVTFLGFLVVFTRELVG